MLVQASQGQSGSAHVVVLGNEKGGSGKSTTALHIAVALLKAGAERREQHDRDHAPYDAEHRQEAAQLVRHQIGPGLSKQFAHKPWLVRYRARKQVADR